MNPTLALFWKEGREAAYKIAACAGLAMIVGLLYNLWDYPGRIGPGPDVDVVGHFVGLIGAVLMGMDAIARERSRTTLPFLLCRPLPPWRFLAVKFSVGGAGLLAMLAAYWAGVFLVMEISGNSPSQSGYIIEPDFTIRTFFPPEEILSDMGYVRVVCLWLLVYLVPYAVAALASVLSDHPLKGAMTSLMVVWIAWVLFIVLWGLAPQFARFYFRLVFILKITTDAEIVRQAFDTSLLLIRTGATTLLAGGVLLCACRLFKAQSNNRFQWIVGGLALVSAVVVVALAAVDRSRRSPISRAPWVPAVGHLKYESPTMDLARNDELTVVLLECGLSVVDASSPQAPAEIGRVQLDGWRLEKLALSGTDAYVWGETGDSVGVVLFDLSLPKQPKLRAYSLLFPLEESPIPWLGRIPRIVGWSVWNGNLYAGLLRKDFLELHSFDVRDGGSPRRIQVFTIEETTKHAWNNGWEMSIVGPRAFLALGHDFVVVDLTDPARPDVLSRTPLRRFGRSVHYEQLVEVFYEQLISKGTPSSGAQILSAGFKSLTMDQLSRDIATLMSYKVSAPPALGPLTVANGSVFIERHLPREIAVLDISDTRKPVEVDYIPRTGLSRQMTVHGESAFALTKAGIQAYTKTRYGVFSKRERLVLDNVEARARNIDFVDLDSEGAYPARDKFILEGKHIYALLNDNLAIFENPRKTE